MHIVLLIFFFSPFLFLHDMHLSIQFILLLIFYNLNEFLGNLFGWMLL